MPGQEQRKGPLVAVGGGEALGLNGIRKGVRSWELLVQPWRGFLKLGNFSHSKALSNVSFSRSKNQRSLFFVGLIALRS